MSWSRGFLRAWFALSVVWFAATAAFAYAEIQRAPRLASDEIFIHVAVAFAALPSVGLFLLGLATAWIIKGFRRTS
jgi:hypothetical protein